MLPSRLFLLLLHLDLSFLVMTRSGRICLVDTNTLNRSSMSCRECDAKYFSDRMRSLSSSTGCWRAAVPNADSSLPTENSLLFSSMLSCDGSASVGDGCLGLTMTVIYRSLLLYLLPMWVRAWWRSCLAGLSLTTWVLIRIIWKLLQPHNQQQYTRTICKQLGGMELMTKKNMLLCCVAYSFVMSILLNIFGMCLSYEEQFYDWNIINMSEARKELFKSALLHTLLLLGSLGFYYFKYDLSRTGFTQLRNSDEDLGSV